MTIPTTSKERPILFSAPMIRAILDGRKTMTRRVIKTVPGIMKPESEVIPLPSLVEAYQNAWIKTCPFGQPGDQLWVREAWQFNPYGGIVHRAGSGIMDCDGRGWKSPIFMPRWASRITLEITAVRVERLKDITVEDAQAEGVTPLGEEGDGRRWRAAFRELWDSLNAKRGYGWDANPWVWVISFKRVQP